MDPVIATRATSPPIPIIAFANTPWDSLWMNRQHLLSRLASRGHPVAYSNGTVHYSMLTQVPFAQRTELRDCVVLARDGYLLPRTHRHSWLNRLSIRHHVQMLKRALGMTPGQTYLAMCFDPGLLEFLDEDRVPLKAFHIYDSYNLMDESQSDFATLRRRIRACDLITASSRQMYEDVLGDAPLDSHVLPNGVDYQATLATLDRPSATAEHIRALPGPRIGYIGSVNTKVHFRLIHALAVARPSASFILVGPVRTAVIARHPQEWAIFQALRALPNVHLLPEIHRDEVPATMNAMDVNCLFYRVDRPDWVAAGYPIKLHEYLAVGRPVLSTAISVVQQQFSSVVSVCDGPDEWLAALDRYIAGGDSAELLARRRQVAASNDWNNRIDQFEALLAQALSLRQSAARGA